MKNEKCINCFHMNACLHLIDERHEELVDCEHFADKSKIILLPVELGTKVWGITQPCGGCTCFNEPMTEQFIEECRKCKQYDIAEMVFDYELIPEFGEFVFATKEETEAALGKLKRRDFEK